MPELVRNVSTPSTILPQLRLLLISPMMATLPRLVQTELVS